MPPGSTRMWTCWLDPTPVGWFGRWRRWYVMRGGCSITTVDRPMTSRGPGWCHSQRRRRATSTAPSRRRWPARSSGCWSSVALGGSPGPLPQALWRVRPSGGTAPAPADAAVLVVGRFEEDVAVVRRVRGWPRAPALLAAVAAGLPVFGEQLGPAAEGVLGPVQWWPSRRRPEVGPTGADFADRYRRRTGREPSYVAAQAAAAGYLAHAAHRRGLAAEPLRRWRTSTLLGDFALDDGWHQVGHRVRTIRWQHGRMVPVGQAPAGALGLD